MPSISYSEIRGSKLLIMGDVNTGKTMMTKELLDEAIESDPGEVTVLDMAPRTFIVEGISFGGLLVGLGDYDVRCLISDEISTPRLSAETSEELLELADQNREKIERLLDEFQAHPSRILFINDVSIYLQCGKLERLWDTINLAETVVANGYFGIRLEEDLGTGVSARERRLMEELASKMDVVIDSSSLKPRLGGKYDNPVRERRARRTLIKMKIPRVLSIAGSDSGGGAGIQADLKTFAALGVHGMTAVTAITAQNTLGVIAIQEVEPSIIKAQIDAVVTDIGVDAVKIGMLHSANVIEAVAEKIEEYGLPAVVDPVMVTTSGSELLKPEAKTSLVDRLLPLAIVLTPNVHEAEILSGIEIKSLDDAKEAAKRIAALGPKAVLVKGGHLALDKAVDVLYSEGEFTVLEAPLHDTVNTHGSGCSLSSAIAAQIAKGDGIVEAVKKAKMFVNRGIKHGLDIGEGPGPVNPMADLYNEVERIAVIEDVREAVAMVEASPGMRDLVAECQMNIGMALSYAVDPLDVAAVDGRLTRQMDGVRAAGCPRFGASRHIANTILAVMEFDKRKRAALNLKYSAEIVEACKAVGLTVSYYDRREEPEEFKRMEGMTTRWGAGEAVKRAGETPDVIYHLGDWGKEPMVVLVGETATQVAGWAIQVMERLGDS